MPIQYQFLDRGSNGDIDGSPVHFAEVDKYLETFGITNCDENDEIGGYTVSDTLWAIINTGINAGIASYNIAGSELITPFVVACIMHDGWGAMKRNSPDWFDFYLALCCHILCERYQFHTWR